MNNRVIVLFLLALLSFSISLPSFSLSSIRRSSPSIIEIENNIKILKANITTTVEAQDYQLAASLKTKLTELLDKLSKAIKFEAAICNEFPLPQDVYNISYNVYNDKIKDLEIKYSFDIDMIMIYIKYFLLMAADRGCGFVAFSSFNLGWPIVFFQDGFTMNFSKDWVASIKEELTTITAMIKNHQQPPPNIGAHQNCYSEKEMQNLNIYQKRLKDKLSSIKEINETLTEPISILSSPIDDDLKFLIEWKLLEMGYFIGRGLYGNTHEWLVVNLWPFAEPQCTASYIKHCSLQYADIDSFPFDGSNYQKTFRMLMSSFQPHSESYLHTRRRIDFTIPSWIYYNVTGGIFNDDDIDTI